jgi:hypothetical protein
VCLADLNNDGVLDAVFLNEGQESAVLLGNRELVATSKRTAVTLRIGGASGVIGSRVRVLDATGKCHGERHVSGGDGRGCQHPLAARFTLPQGNFRVEVRYSSGLIRAREVTVADTPLRGLIDERTPKVELEVRPERSER